jgi:hypothetical protein
VEARIPAANGEVHAQLAMKAARSVARARRRSQKEKMGRVVCHHLLLMLNEEGTQARGTAGAQPEVSHVTVEPQVERQFSLRLHA